MHLIINVDIFLFCFKKVIFVKWNPKCWVHKYIITWPFLVTSLLVSCGPADLQELVLLLAQALRSQLLYFNPHQGYCSILRDLLRNSMLRSKPSKDSVLKIPCVFCSKY